MIGLDEKKALINYAIRRLERMAEKSVNDNDSFLTNLRVRRVYLPRVSSRLSSDDLLLL